MVSIIIRSSSEETSRLGSSPGVLNWGADFCSDRGFIRILAPQEVIGGCWSENRELSSSFQGSSTDGAALERSESTVDMFPNGEERSVRMSDMGRRTDSCI